MGKNIIRLENLRKLYCKNEILKNINLEIKQNEFFTLLGPTRNIYFNDEEISDLPPYKRKINTVK